MLYDVILIIYILPRKVFSFEVRAVLFDLYIPKDNVLNKWRILQFK